MKSIIISKRFCGPPDSGNGGYTCGLISTAMGAPAEVTLRKPIPIERPLQIQLDGRGDTWTHATLKDDQELIAEAVNLDWPLERAPNVSFAQAESAQQNSPAFKNHPFPTCFVCGPERPAGDGLRIFPGIVSDLSPELNKAKHTFAATFTPNASFADADGNIREEIIWAALDCPTGFAGGFPYAGKLVTGRLGAKLIAPVHAGEKCVLVSWPLGVEGRKHHAAAVLIGEHGTVRAQAKATWIKLD